MTKNEGNGEGGHKRYATANEILEQAWKASMVARLEEIRAMVEEQKRRLDALLESAETLIDRG
jgi:hypothetical protein